MSRIFAALLLLTAHGQLFSQQAPNEPQWLCEMSDYGNGTRTVPIRESHHLQWFAGHIAEFDPQVAGRMKYDSRWRDMRAEIAPVGKLGGRDVIDVLFTVPDRAGPVGKLVLIGQREQFRPVVWILADGGVHLTHSKVVNVSNTSILVSRDRMDGTGHFYYEYYFLFDETDSVPITLPVGSVIGAELKRILPEGRGVWKGGGFDIDSLHYTSGVWAEGDPNCCPSAGKVNIQLALVGRTVVVMNSAYDPGYKWR